MPERYTPELLSQANWRLRVDMFKGLNGLDPWRFCDLYTSTAVASSLRRFADKQKSSGDFYERLGEYLKPDHNFRPQAFDLTTYFKSNVRLGLLSPNDPSRLFSFDTDHGLVLSLYSGQSALGWCLGLKVRIPASPLVPTEVRIEQIQGQTYPRPDFFLTGFRWEKLLVELACAWAKSQGIPRILLLPAEQNRYWFAEDCDPYNQKRQERLKMHYNVTAERFGFTRDKTPESVYSLELEDFPLRY